MKRSRSDCQELYRNLLRVLDEKPTEGSIIFYIRTLYETSYCDHISDQRSLRKDLYQQLNKGKSDTIGRIMVGDLELGDGARAVDLMNVNRSQHQRCLSKNLPLRERFWYWTGGRIQNFFHRESSIPQGRYSN